MTKWIFEINLKDIWDKHIIQDEFTREEVRSLSKEIVKRIKESTAYQKYPHELRLICNKISRCGKIETFNKAMDRLYDWADYRQCWVSTLF